MKSFLKYTLATITGILIASILLFFISFMGLGMMMASADKAVSINEKSVLVLNTAVNIPDRGIDDPFATFDPVEFTFKPSPGINDILANLEKAATDENIAGVLIQNGPMVNGWSKAKEIRDALLRFKESGKFVISYTDYYLTQESYYISTAADKVYLNPVAIFEFKGIGSEIMFYKKALEKIGVEVQVVRHGKFKGAVEPFMGNRLSEENRTQIKRYISSIWNTVLGDISVSRQISNDSLDDIADGLKTTDTAYALESNMIDGLMYKDELIKELNKLADRNEDDKPELVSMSRYKKVEPSKKSRSLNRIAVVYAEGTIVMGKGTPTNIGGNQYASTIKKIRESGRYKALVLRVNSPGGNAMASDLIWREVELAARVMPVVVSMGNYAASGGYYISAPATAIFAQESTLTGSIGVFGMIPQAGSLLKEKIGISTESVMTNKYADSPSIYRPMDSYETEMMQKNVDKTYDDFITKVSSGRQIDKSLVDDMGQGQVYTGTDALAKNLVDSIGGLSDAIAYAAKLASLDDYRTIELPTPEDPYTRLMKSLGGDIRSRIIQKELGPASAFYSDINEITNMKGIQARLPFFIEFK